MSDEVIDVAIVGAASLVAGELIQILLRHPNVNLKLLISESHAGQPVDSVHGFLKGSGLRFDEATGSAAIEKIGNECGCMFLASGNGMSMETIGKMKDKGFVQ